MINTDFLVVGAGIVGLSIARELKSRNPKASVIVLEKEPEPGMHSSGRNSGVLHSGIYYQPDSLKAKVCAQGAREMAAYHERNGLRLDRRGKVLVATNVRDAPQIDLLYERAKANEVTAELLDEQGLRKLEPEARSAVGKAIWIQSTSVGSPAAVMATLLREVREMGVEVRCDDGLKGINHRTATASLSSGDAISFGHAINSAGLYADKIAHLFDVGLQYTLLPFKGIYWRLDPKSGLKINHLIYPVPDLRVPFLGVHTTTTTDGHVYLGPTAAPAFGRENYKGMQGTSPIEFARISSLLLQQFIRDQDGFRRLVWQEGRKYFKHWFFPAAKAVLPRLQPSHLLPTEKVGIRAQMLDAESGKLVTDFLVESGPRSTHILNAISPAWTCAFPFARHVCDDFIERNL